MADQPSRRKRGRPPHPDILTPREWQVLDLLRQDLTNEQIAHRLDISPATAKYHVSEIISKLGVTTREEAAAWQPSAEAAWWQRLLTPFASVLRRMAPITLAKSAMAAGALMMIAGLALLVWGAGRSGEGDNTVRARPTPTEPPPTAALPSPIPRPTEKPIVIQTPAPTDVTSEPFLYGRFPWRNALYAMDPDSGALEVLLDRPPATYEWSPDGTRMAFIQGYSDIDLRFATIDGELLHSIRATPMHNLSRLSWSPDSAHIALMGNVLEPGDPPAYAPGQNKQVPAIAFLNVGSGKLEGLYRPPSIFDAENGYNLSSSLEWTADGRIMIEETGWGEHRRPAGRGIMYLDVNGTLEPTGSPLLHAVPGRPDAKPSPDRTMFAYVSGNDPQIRLAQYDGSQDRGLATGYDPAWSPDSRRIAFVRSGFVHTINADGTEEQQLVGSEFPLFSRPHWSPDGRVLFHFGPYFETFVVDSGGGTPVRSSPGYAPRWSPNGEWVSFMAGSGGIGGGGDLFVMRPDGSNIKRLPIRTGYSDAIGGCSYAELQWSNDSSRIGIDRGFSGTAITPIDREGPPDELGRACSALSPDLLREAFTVQPDFDKPCSVLVGRVDEAPGGGRGGCGIPKWSPDGSQIAYVSGEQILVVPATGGAPRVVADIQTGGYIWPQRLEWSFDGTRLAYVSNGTIRVTSIADPTDADSLPKPESVDPASFVDPPDGYGPDATVSEPDWSPDGLMIAFTLYRSPSLSRSTYGSRDIYITAADGSGAPRKVARGYDPQWSPDGTMIAFTRDAAQ